MSIKISKKLCRCRPFHGSHSKTLQARTLKFWPFTNSRTLNRMVPLTWRSGAPGSQYGGTDYRKIWHVIYRWNQDNFLSILSINTCRTLLGPNFDHMPNLVSLERVSLTDSKKHAHIYV